jgi:hypothetical protein
MLPSRPTRTLRQCDKLIRYIDQKQSRPQHDVIVETSQFYRSHWTSAAPWLLHVPTFQLGRDTGRNFLCHMTSSSGINAPSWFTRYIHLRFTQAGYNQIYLKLKI